MSELLADSAHGVFVWKYLGENYRSLLLDGGVTKEQIKLLLSNPYETDCFWENVEEVISDFQGSYQGEPHFLFFTENGDLFLFSDMEMEELLVPSAI